MIANTIAALVSTTALAPNGADAGRSGARGDGFAETLGQALGQDVAQADAGEAPSDGATAAADASGHSRYRSMIAESGWRTPAETMAAQTPSAPQTRAGEANASDASVSIPQSAGILVENGSEFAPGSATAEEAGEAGVAGEGDAGETLSDASADGPAVSATLPVAAGVTNPVTLSRTTKTAAPGPRAMADGESVRADAFATGGPKVEAGVAEKPAPARHSAEPALAAPLERQAALASSAEPGRSDVRRPASAKPAQQTAPMTVQPSGEAAIVTRTTTDASVPGQQVAPKEGRNTEQIPVVPVAIGLNKGAATVGSESAVAPDRAVAPSQIFTPAQLAGSGEGAKPAAQIADAVARDMEELGATRLSLSNGVASARPLRSLNLQLNPAELGVVNIRLQATQDGLRVTIRAESDKTADMLSKDAEAIRSALRGAGISTSDVTVSVTRNDPGAQQQFSGQHRDAPGQQQPGANDNRGNMSNDSRTPNREGSLGNQRSALGGDDADIGDGGNGERLVI